MKDVVKKILEDVYAVDPSLKNREKELTRIVESLLEVRPQVRMDEGFRRVLRERILLEARKKKPSLWEEVFSGQYASMFAGALVLILVLGGVWYWDNGGYVAQDTGSPEKMMLSRNAENLPPPAPLGKGSGGMQESMLMVPLAVEDGGICGGFLAEDFPVEEVYAGPVAPPDFSTNPDAEMFRTRIQDGVKEGVNFAGHYIFVSWGCGTSCQGNGIVDAETGEITEFGLGSSFGARFSPDSMLLVLNPPENILGEVPLGVTTEYYVLEGGHLKNICEEGIPER